VRMLAISDRRSLGKAWDGGLPSWLAALARAGVEGVELREKVLDDAELLDLARSARATLGAIPLLVNGRVDVALAAGAAGVHLPADGVPVAAVRRRFGRAVAIGRSTHRLDEVAAAREDGADYVTFGPVFATPGKGPPAGLEALAAAARLGLPILALGGITLERLPEVAAAGAAGIAAIRLFQDPARLPAVAAALAGFPGIDLPLENAS
jgi:thiamine-phosphate pyrophosphorylase